MSLWRKRVLITGAARGIGAATARNLHQRGARCVLVDMDTDALRALGAELGERHIVMPGDVTDPTSIQLAVDAASEKWNGLDVVIANAGIASWGTVRQIDPEAFARTIEVNLTGVFRTVRAALPVILESRGYVLLVSSLAAMLPMPAGSAYGASKAGVEAFANALRLELAGHGVNVGSAHMGVIETEMVNEAKQSFSVFDTVHRMLPGPMRRTVTAEECAERFTRAVEQRSRKVYVPAPSAVTDPLRFLLNSPLSDWLIIRLGAGLISEAETQLAAVRGSLSERIAKLGVHTR